MDPQSAAWREEAARADRRVEASSLPDAMGELRVQAPGYAIAIAQANLDRAARAVRRRGDPRTMDQLRCDIAIGWLTEGRLGTLIVRPPQPAIAISADSADSADSAESATQADPDDWSRIALPFGAAFLCVLGMPARTALGLDDHPATLYGVDGPTSITRAPTTTPSRDAAARPLLGSS